MKNIIVTSLLSLFTMVCLSQDIYNVKVNHLEVGNYLNDTTSVWSDSVLVNQTTIMVNNDSVIIKDKFCEKVYKLLSQKDANPGVNSFYSVDEKTNKPYVVTYFTSSCLDNVSITVIVDDEKTSHNYHGIIQ